MENVVLIGIDLAKHSFHIHCQDRSGKALLHKKFNRTKLIEFLATFPACTIVMEACAGAHHMARQLAKFGHESKLICPQFVRSCVRLSIATKTTSLMLKPFARRPAVPPCGS